MANRQRSCCLPECPQCWTPLPAPWIHSFSLAAQQFTMNAKRNPGEWHKNCSSLANVHAAVEAAAIIPFMLFRKSHNQKSELRMHKLIVIKSKHTAILTSINF
jgi:hypothetical protein